MTLSRKKSLATTVLMIASLKNSMLANAVTNVVVGSDPNLLADVNWSDGVCYAPISDVRIGDTIEFKYAGHNVYKMRNYKAFKDCDFDDAIELSGIEQTNYRHEITQDDVDASDDGGSLFFACKYRYHCWGDQKIRVNVNTDLNFDVTSTKTPVSHIAIGFSTDLCDLVQRGEADISGVTTNDDINSDCLDPVVTTDDTQEMARTVHSTTCLSKPFTMTPGGVINQVSFVHFPFPVDRRVLLGDRAFEFVAGDPDDDMAGLQSVSVNQLYVHHILGGIVRGTGAESIQRRDFDAAFPLPYGILTGDFDNIMTFHLIDLRETGDQWLECAECRCQEDHVFEDAGGIDCCTNCTSLISPTIDYRMRYNVSWTELSELDVLVEPIIAVSTNIYPSGIEFDIPQYNFLPSNQQLPEDPTIQVLKRSGTFRTLFSMEFPPIIPDYDGPDLVEIHRCAGHLHIGGLLIQLEDLETGEIICSSDATYGSDPTADLGFITSMGVHNFEPPIVIPADREIQLVTHYNATEKRVGVMGLLLVWITEKQEGNVSPDEASLVVDVCKGSTCDVSILPEWCADTLLDTQFCKVGNICDCESLLELSFVPGCGEVFSYPGIDDIPINSICQNTCGACTDNVPTKDVVRQALEVKFKFEADKLCRYNSDGCRRYLSNMYSCSQEMPDVNNLDPVVKSVIIEEGRRIAMDNAKLGNPFMHNLIQASNFVYPCSTGDKNDSTSDHKHDSTGDDKDDGTKSIGHHGRAPSILIGFVLPAALTAFCFH